MIADIIARLQAEAMPPLAGIEGASELAALSGPPPATPWAWVLASRETAGENRLATIAVDQKITLQFQVSLLAFNAADLSGGAGALDLQAIREGIFAALLGWMPPGADEPITFVEGGAGPDDDGLVTWADIFKTSYHRRVL